LEIPKAEQRLTDCSWLQSLRSFCPTAPQFRMPEDLDMEAAISELNEKLPGLGELLEPDHPGA